MLLSRAMFPQN